MAPRKRSRARTVKVLKAHGRSNIKRDKQRTAKKPGRRISKSGKRYTETRRNRSDTNRKKRY